MESELERPPTVGYFPGKEQGQAYSKDYRAGLTSGFLIGFSCACLSVFILSLVIVVFN